MHRYSYPACPFGTCRPIPWPVWWKASQACHRQTSKRYPALSTWRKGSGIKIDKRSRLEGLERVTCSPCFLTSTSIHISLHDSSSTNMDPTKAQTQACFAHLKAQKPNKVSLNVTMNGFGECGNVYRRALCDGPKYTREIVAAPSRCRVCLQVSEVATGMYGEACGVCCERKAREVPIRGVR